MSIGLTLTILDPTKHCIAGPNLGECGPIPATKY